MKAIINNKIIQVNKLYPFWEKDDFLNYLNIKYGSQKLHNILVFLSSIIIGANTVSLIREKTKNLKIQISDKNNCPSCLNGFLRGGFCLGCKSTYDKILNEIIEISNEQIGEDMAMEKELEQECPICLVVMTDKYICNHCKADLNRFFRCPFKNQQDYCDITKNFCNYKALEYEQCNVFHENNE